MPSTRRAKIDGVVQTSASHVERERWWMESDDFEAVLTAFPEGYSKGLYDGRRYGVSFRRSNDERRNSLLARQLARTGIVSFNLYRLG
jgi:hypothetical protein